MSEMISVVVPVFNVEKYIKRCIDSILSQTYRNYEIILVDDGSPDNCPRICDEYSEKHENITVIHQSNMGLSAARNTGITAAKGTYITFIDSDDFIHPRMLDELMGSIYRHNVKISMCLYKRVYGNIGSDDIQLKNDELKIVDDKQAMEMLLIDQSLTTAWGKLYNIKLFRNIRFPIRKTYEDMFVAPILFKLAKNISLDRRAMYYYNQDGPSITRSDFSYNILDMVEATQFWVYHTKENYSDLYEMSIVHHYSIMIGVCPNLIKAGGVRGKEIYHKYENEILNNFKMLIYSKHTRINDKIKYIIMKCQLFPLLVKLKY